MDFEGTTYRPPPEADTVLLQVTVGCAHNRCTFCSMYRDVQFRTIPLDRIESDLKEAKYIYGRAERIFLVNGDAFVLSANKLKSIIVTIRKTFPECRTVSMYASIRDIRAKSDDDLQMLKALGVDDLYVGLESGSPDVLAAINKGHTVEESYHHLERLNRFCIGHIPSLMLGIAGKGNGIDNARQTAALLNASKPKMVWVGTYAPFEGTELYEAIQQGRFKPASELEVLREEQELIRLLELEGIRYFGNHPTNIIPVSGFVPRDKDKMIDTIEAGILQYGEAALDKQFNRTSL